MPEQFTPGIGGGTEEPPGFRGLIPLAAITAPKWNLQPKIAEFDPAADPSHHPTTGVRVRSRQAVIELPTSAWREIPVEASRAHEFQHLADWNDAPTFMARQWSERRGGPLGKMIGHEHAPSLRALLSELRAGMAEEPFLQGGAARNLRGYVQASALGLEPRDVLPAARQLYPGVPSPIEALLDAAKRDPVALHEKILGLMREANVPSKIVNILRQTIPQMIAKGVRGPTDLALQMIPQSLLQQMSQQIQGPQG